VNTLRIITVTTADRFKQIDVAATVVQQLTTACHTSPEEDK